MSWTVDSLDIQIKSSAGSAASNINELADALGKLNANSKVTKITNSLGKLNDALSSMSGQQAVMSNLSALSNSLSSLASIPKLTGLQSAVRELKKMPEVMSNLGTAEIEQFTIKMRALASGLAPLAAQIDKIGNGFSKLPSKVSKVVTAVKRLDNANKSAAKSTNSHSKALNTQSINLLTAYENMSNVFSMLHGIQDAFAKVLKDAIQWDGIQFQFGRAFGEDAEEVLAYAEKVSKALKINQQQFMESASLYGSLLKGFGVEQELVTTMGVGLAELSYDIWAAYNNRYKTLEDASEAVRSAITGEIEPIRNAGIALTEASMQEYLDSVGKAHISVEKLTEAQKSELRYAVMVNAAMNQGIIGTYAREMDTAEGAVRTFTQQLKTLGQAFGSLFIPVLKEVVPWLSAFVELITEGIIALGKMFGINFQEITWGNAKGMAQTADGAVATADALGDAAKSAKAMKDYTMGFDELNIIKPDSGSSGAGAGAGGLGSGESLGLGIDTLWNDAILAQASTQIDELKEKIKAYAEEHKTMLTIVGSVGAFLTFAKIIRGLNSLLGITATWGGLKTVFNGISAAMLKITGATAGIKTFFSLWKESGTLTGTLAATFPKLATGVESVLKWFTPLAAAVKAVAGFFGLPVWAVVAGIIAAIASVAYFLYENWEKVTIAAKGFFDTNIVPKLDSIKESWERIKEALAPIGGVIAKVIEAFGGMDFVRGVLSGLAGMFEGLGGIIFSVVSTVIAGAISAAVNLFAGLAQAFSGMVQIVSGAIQLIVSLFTLDLKAASDALELIVWGVINAFVGMVDAVIGTVVDFVKGIIDWFTELWDVLVGHSIVPDMVEAIIDWFLSLPGKILGPIKEFCDNVMQKFKDLWNNAKTWYANNVAPKFTRDYWVNKFAGLKEGFVQTIKNMLNTGIELFNRFIGWLNEKLHFEWEPIEIMGKTVVPGGNIQLFTIPQIVGRFEDGGFLEDGLFTMNHGEIAGKFNNGKSVVANNQQIVDGIAAGVYEAVVAAMGASRSSSGQNVNVYLDGKQIYASVRKRESERGMQLIGDQLGYA